MPGTHVLTTCLRTVTALARGVVAFVRGVAFWTAIVLPVAALALFLVDPTRYDPVDIGAFVAVNVTALVLGQGYTGSVAETFEDLHRSGRT